MRATTFFFLLTIVIGSLTAQHSEYQHFQYTIDDGLPSNECHDAVMDAYGYLWIATDRGLSRYDGYGFKNYGIEEGLTDLSCLDLFLDHQGRIWITTFGRKVFIYLPESDRIIEYEYNEVIAQANEPNQIIQDLYVDSLSNLHVSLDDTGLIKIDRSGIVSNLSQHLDESYFIHTIDKRPFFGVNRGLARLDTLININGKQGTLVTGNELHVGRYRVLKLYNDFSYFGANGYRYLVQYDTIISEYHGELFQDLERLSDDRIITGQIFNGGLKLYGSYEALFTDEYEVVFPDISVSNILRIGNDLFVTTTDQGVFYFRNKRVSTISQNDLSLDRITSISTDGDDNLLAVIDKTEVVKYKISTGETTSIDLSLREIYDIHFSDRIKNLIIGGTPQSYYFEEDTSRPVITYSTYYNRINDRVVGKSIIPIDTTGIIIIRYDGFGEYESLDDLPIFDSNIHHIKLRFNTAIRIAGHSYLTGGPKGLYYMDTTRLVCLDSINSLFAMRINDMVQYEEMIYIGTQGSGVLVWDQKDSVRVINKSNGLISNNVEKLHLSNQNQLSVGTYSGLSMIDISQSAEMHIENYTVHNGLPANDIYDFDSMGDTLLVATGKGIAMITSKEEADLHPSPLIEDVFVNGASIDLEKKTTTLDYSQNDVMISYRCLDLTMRGDIEYQVAINDNLWSETKSTSINYAALQPGYYSFKVRSANSDGVWGETAFYNFTVLKPWWNTFWFYIIVGALSVLFIYGFYSRRVKSLEKKVKVQNDMARLERSALQAQMNPHFIFNCLNSIQSFIMANEKEIAMEYLSKFAQLIRQNLEISTESKLYLSEEIEMLKNYIELEQVRYNNAFDYDIKVGKNINQDDVLIPPLLIQPYVENAILHGMKGKEGDGLIEITFEKHKDKLKVSVRDNGEGLKKSQSVNHKSMGMSITQKRLNFINSHKKGGYDIQTSSNEAGTEISIDIVLS